MSKFRQLLNDKRGVNSIELVISVLILLIIFAFGVDVIRISLGFSTISKLATDIARIGSIQGGFNNRPPAYFPGKERYMTINELEEYANEQITSVGFQPEDLSISIEPKRGNSREIDYGTHFDVYVKLNYRWFMLENVFKTDMTSSITAKRMGMSEWKFNYNSWSGEV